MSQDPLPTARDTRATGRDALAAALERARTILDRRPDLGPHDDAAATARWEGGTRVVASHANGREVVTDMPKELGGSGDQLSPGWFFRAGMASCTATTIAMRAALQGIELTALEVRASSRSDTRALLVPDAQAEGLAVGSYDLALHVRIAARNASPQRLRELVEDANRISPMSNAVCRTASIPVHTEVEEA